MAPPAGEAFEVFVQQVIVPTCGEIGGNLDLGVPALHTVRLPEIVEYLVPNDLTVERALGDIIEH
jgi:hypothetical protein